MPEEKLEPWQEYLRENELAEQARMTRIDEKDGTVYEWNDKHKGWFPKVNEDFILKHNVEYGFGEDLNPIPQTPTQETPAPNSRTQNPPESRKQKKPKNHEEKNEPEWFQVDKSHDTHVYVSGMPKDITEDEFIDMMAKFGVIMEDPDTKKLKVKLYKEADGSYKGDGLICYLKHESVELAINILDESVMRGNTLRVDYASFELKGDFNPAIKPKKRKKSKMKNQDKLLDWNEREQYKKGANRRACVIHYLFNPKEFADDPAAIMDYKNDLMEEASKFGDVKKRSEDGVASVLFKDEDSAQKCVDKMDGRLCDGRILIAHLWDGVTKYQTEETEEEREARLQKWHDSLES